MTATDDRPKVRLSANYWRLWAASVSSNLGDGIALVAYPWLASAVTRDPVLIALITVAQRLPWLFFTLPAGVITDRVDRRKLMLTMDITRAGLIFVIAATVLAAQGDLPSPAQVAAGVAATGTMPLYFVLLGAAVLMGMAEVLRDNSAQTLLPAVVDARHLEKANGNLWGAEMVVNSFIGPSIGSALVGIGFALPFFVNAGAFGVAAGVLLLITGTFRARGTAEAPPTKVRWGTEIKEGVAWLWRHPVLRPMAIILGFLNGLVMMSMATFILFAQENLDLETGLFTGALRPVADFFGVETVAAFIFSLLMMAGAVGGVLGSLLAPRVMRAMGQGPALYMTVIAGGATSAIMGMATRWWVVFLMTAVGMFVGMVWNVITVSFRQSIIPDRLLGRVNSVYRFLGWGMMPIGSLIGGLVVTVFTPWVGRSDALRWPFFLVAIAHVGLLVYAVPRLSTKRLAEARAAAEPTGR